jgi:hypothetical protein
MQEINKSLVIFVGYLMMLFDTCTAPDGRMAEKMGKGFGRRRLGHN